MKNLTLNVKINLMKYIFIRLRICKLIVLFSYICRNNGLIGIFCIKSKFTETLGKKKKIFVMPKFCGYYILKYKSIFLLLRNTSHPAVRYQRDSTGRDTTEVYLP